ncbi:hypothetical protein AB0F18_13060 [Streptomyces sp. NPDC029216]|uniref:hypothetical protein n=1 Tax=Streptomyces sp. NPDC029216 TaxID=3154701 RepID=UPI0033CA76AE
MATRPANARVTGGLTAASSKELPLRKAWTAPGPTSERAASSGADGQDEPLDVMAAFEGSGRPGRSDSDVSGVWWDGRTLPLIFWEPFVTPSYPSLTHALTEALVDVLWFIEGCEDEQMDPDDAVKVLEGVPHVVSTLPDDQRQGLIELVGEMAAAENNPARRAFLEGFPEGFGLIDDAS